MLITDTFPWNSTQFSSTLLLLIMVWDPHPDCNSLSDTDPLPTISRAIPIPYAPITVEPWMGLLLLLIALAMLFHFLENLFFLIFTWLHPTCLRVCHLNITFLDNPSSFLYRPPALYFYSTYNSPLSTCHDWNYLHNFYLTTALSQKAPWGRDYYICLFHFCEFCT